MTIYLRPFVAAILVANILPLHAADPIVADALPEGVIARFGVTRPRWDSYGAAAFAKDGSLVTVDDKLNIYRWDSTTGRVLRQRQIPCPDTAWPRLSDRGSRLAARYWGAAKIQLWDADTGEFLRDFAVNGPDSISEFALAPDGESVAAVARTKSAQSLWLWGSTGSAKRLHEGGNIQPPAFSPDGKSVATFANQSLKCWDAVSGELLWTGEAAKIVDPSSFRFTPDGQFILASPGANGGPSLCWNVANGKLTAKLPIPSETFLRLPLLSADGRTLIASIGNDKVRVLDRQTGRMRREIADVEGVLALAPDGRSIYGWMQSGMPQRWELETGKPLWPEIRDMGHHGGVTRVALSPDGRTLVSIGNDNKAQIWDVPTRRSKASLRMDSDSLAVFSADGRYLVLGKDSDAIQWDVRKNQSVGSLSTPSEKHDQFISVEPSRDGKSLVALLHRGREPIAVAEWDIATRKQTFYRAIDGLNQDGMLLPGGEHWFCLSGNVQDIRSGKTVMTVVPPTDSPPHDWAGPITVARSASVVACVSTARHDPDGNPLPINAANPQESAIRLWESDTGRMIQTIRLDRIGRFELSPNGRWLAMIHPNGFDVREVATGKIAVVRSCQGVRSLVVSADGRTVATGLVNGTVVLWDLAPLGFKAKTKLSESELNAIWSEFLDDAPTGYGAICRLSAAPTDALTFLRSKMKPVSPLSDEQLRNWIADLGSPRFAIRETASKELIAIGERAVPALRAAQRGPLPPEANRRIERILGNRDPSWIPDTVRYVRAIDALERIGTPVARELLAVLATGDPNVPETRAARESLERMGK